MAKTPRSTTAVGSDADAVTSRTVPGADAAASGTTGGPLPDAGENTREGLLHLASGGLVGGEAVNGPATPTREGDAAAAAASALLDGRPQDASRAAEAAAGSALDAPGVGSGPVSEPLGQGAHDAFAGRYGVRSDIEQIEFVGGERLVLADLARNDGVVIGGPAVEVGAASGLPPARMSSEGSFGGVPEADRHALAGRIDAIAGGPVLRSAGYKRAVSLPKDRANVPELIAEGFDLIVTAKHDGFRRAGVGHPATPTLRRSEDFSPAELLEMDADPMLVVQALR